jgi:hypothetical protein
VQRRSKSRSTKNAQPGTPDGRGLILRATPEARLNKGQREFNRLVRRIEELQRAIAEENQRLDRLVAFYHSNVFPLEQEIIRIRREILRGLLARLSGLPKGRSAEKKRLLKILQHQMANHMIELNDTFDDEFLALFQAIMKCTPKEFEQREKNKIQAEIQKEMQQELEDMNVDVDLSGLAPGSTIEEIQRTLDEVQRTLGARRDAEKPPETDFSKRQRQEEEERQRLAEEMKSKDVARLYKQLAKLLHPDLELDPERRSAKEAAMKQLNASHEAGDLHAMLKMEIEWITQEGTDAGRLSDHKLAVYNSVLSEQVEELDQTLYTVWTHPRFAVLEPFHQPMLGLSFVHPKDMEDDVRYVLDVLQKALAILNGDPTPVNEKWLAKELGPSKPGRNPRNPSFGFSFF